MYDGDGACRDVSAEKTLVCLLGYHQISVFERRMQQHDGVVDQDLTVVTSSSKGLLKQQFYPTELVSGMPAQQPLLRPAPAGESQAG